MRFFFFLDFEDEKLDAIDFMVEPLLLETVLADEVRSVNEKEEPASHGP